MSLVVPDVQAPIPYGWCQSVAEPLIETLEWESLDDAEAAVNMRLGAVTSLRQDSTELRKALRCIDARHGLLLGAGPGQGARTDLEPRSHVSEVEVEASEPTIRRWRRIAEAWSDGLREVVLTASHASEVSQAAVLATLSDGSDGGESGREAVAAPAAHPDLSAGQEPVWPVEEIPPNPEGHIWLTRRGVAYMVEQLEAGRVKDVVGILLGILEGQP